jgi:hypothetical protein
MISRQQIIEQIKQDWGDQPQSEICSSIFKYLLNLKNQNYFHITYGSLRSVVGGNYEDCIMLICIQYLCGERTHLLNTNFELVDDDENRFEITDTELKIAQSTGQFIHPETGELINNFENQICIYFQPSQLVKNIM